MIRALILWLAKRLLAKYVSAAIADQLVTAASRAYDEIRVRGEEAVSVGADATRPSVILRPSDPGAKPVTINDITSGNIG